MKRKPECDPGEHWFRASDGEHLVCAVCGKTIKIGTVELPQWPVIVIHPAQPESKP